MSESVDKFCLAEARATAQVIGEQVEGCLMNSGITEEEKKEAFADAKRDMKKRLDNIYGCRKKKSLERLAAEGVINEAIAEANLRVIQFQIEKKAASCYQVLMYMGRGHIKTRAECDQIYEEAHRKSIHTITNPSTGVELKAFIDEIIPEDIGKGLEFASKIMDDADEKIKDIRRVKRE